MGWQKRILEKSCDIARALAFLSRIPVPASLFADKQHHSAASQAWAYPLAGMVIGLPGVLIIALFGIIAPHTVTAILVVTVTTIITGALHEDGLADLADGFWGGVTTQRRLEIMKDSAIGSYGVLALIAWFGLSITALTALLVSVTLVQAAFSWLAICAVSRSAMTLMWATTPPARQNGVAYNAGQPSHDAAVMAAIGSLAAVAMALFIGAPQALVLATIVAAGTTAAMRQLCLNKISGHTGDALGATQKAAEAAMLLALAIAV